MEEYPLECIRCKYILKQITEHLTKNKLLKIINYNKLIQNKLDIGIIDYKKYYEQIEIELIPINKKNKNYWKKMDITKWEMNPMAQIDSALLFRDKCYAFSKMCYQETMILNNKGDLLGYYYRNNILNIKNVLESIEKYSIDNLVSFSKEIEPTVTDVVNVWSNLASNL